MDLVRDRDVLSGAVLAALGVFVLKTGLEWNYIGPDGPGPGFFPVWYGILITALSLGLVAKAILRPEADAREPWNWPGVGRALGTWAAFALAVAGMEALGFIVSIGLLTLFVVWVVMGKRIGAALATAIGTAAGFWLVFDVLLGLNLPAGSAWPPLIKAAGLG